MKLKALTILILFCGYSVKAQIIEKPIDYYADYETNRSSRINNDTLVTTIPFFDDFSDHKEGFKKELWYNYENVNLDKNAGSNIPSLGAVRLDGTKAGGIAYSNANIDGYADVITSNIIDLSIVPLNQRDSTYLGFYFQKKGLGEIPDNEDSLIVQMLSQNMIWHNVLGFSGADINEIDTFIYASVKIPDSLFHEKFMFRFINYGNLSGPYDVWNIDYVTLMSSQDGMEGDYPDRTLVSTPKNLFEGYFSYPLDHIKKDLPSNSAPNGVFGKNLSSSIRVVEYGMNILDAKSGSLIETLQQQIVKDTLFSQLGQKLYYSVQAKPASKITDYISAYEGDSLFLEGFFYSQPDDFFVEGSLDYRINDTTSIIYPFIDYYAYDDHSPENGAETIGSGSQVAIQYVIDQPDTLTAIDIYFLGRPGQLVVPYISKDLGNNKNSRSDAVRLPIDGSPARYKIDPILIEDTVYIGFQKFIDAGIPVGLDKDIDSGDKLFYNIDGFWIKNSNITGSIMIRPVFGKIDIITGINDKLKNEVSIYPIPSKGSIKLTENVYNWSIYNINGQFISGNDEYKKGNEIILQNATEGIYIFQGFDNNNNPIKLKFIIQ
ncbi:T9SS type A sorting domain-containing protein [Marinigracilibium pacificum]|uniref:T9SS type A sorting domain-containing protein n=1 Tax=Marinigracilibium pacificum TaxID=2729599 RepID=A0A848J0D4_9BACT|nr:T9SS type A sorting domain-containing protein [Marinigracilibium pacificum]NMM49296.1 T9SS type A sorting domain-containing protein [Marinigracilibium pacificum]